MLLSLSAAARDRLYIEDFEIQAGESIEIPMLLDNDTTYCAFQTDLYLPEGLEVEMEYGEYIIDPTSRVSSRTHVVSTALMPDGAIRIFVSSQSVRPINGNSGAVLILLVKATQDVSNALVELQGSITVEENGLKHYLDNCQAYANPGPSVVLATSVTLDKESAQLTQGETLQLTATVMPQEVTDATVTWSSSNEAVATVDASGLVTAVAPGNATITATTADGTHLTATCQVTVVKPALRGDVNLDGSVDVTDVNIVVNIVLGKDDAANYGGRAYINSDDSVDVADVNTLINIILGKN